MILKHKRKRNTNNCTWTRILQKGILRNYNEKDVYSTYEVEDEGFPVRSFSIVAATIFILRSVCILT